MNNMKSNGQPEPDHERILLDMIERVLSGEWTFDDFSKRYYDYYIDVLPETALEDKQREFFLEAQERLDWTDKNPDPVSRQFGWESPPEYLDWLRTAVAKYLAGRSGSH